jgi:hypothetical protein
MLFPDLYSSLQARGVPAAGRPSGVSRLVTKFANCESKNLLIQIQKITKCSINTIPSYCKVA